MNFISKYVEDGKPAIFLLRHGHIDTGSERRYVGRTDYPLSAVGMKQAEAVRCLLEDIPFSRIISSGLQRARKTTAIITPHQKIKTVPELNEIDMGTWENLSIEQVKADYPWEFEERGLNNGAFSPPDGESFADLQKRVMPVFLTLLQEIGGHTLIVAHAGVNRVILCHLLGMPLDNLFKIEQDFACLNIIAAGARPRVLALNIRPIFGPNAD